MKTNPFSFPLLAFSLFVQGCAILPAGFRPGNEIDVSPHGIAGKLERNQFEEILPAARKIMTENTELVPPAALSYPREDFFLVGTWEASVTIYNFTPQGRNIDEISYRCEYRADGTYANSWTRKMRIQSAYESGWIDCPLQAGKSYGTWSCHDGVLKKTDLSLKSGNNRSSQKILWHDDNEFELRSTDEKSALEAMAKAFQDAGVQMLEQRRNIDDDGLIVHVSTMKSGWGKVRMCSVARPVVFKRVTKFTPPIKSRPGPSDPPPPGLASIKRKQLPESVWRFICTIDEAVISPRQADNYLRKRLTDEAADLFAAAHPGIEKGAIRVSLEKQDDKNPIGGKKRLVYIASPYVVQPIVTESAYDVDTRRGMLVLDVKATARLSDAMQWARNYISEIASGAKFRMLDMRSEGSRLTVEFEAIE